jgi:uroporphyrinogen-III synthase
MTAKPSFRVWVTRPKPQGEVLCQKLEEEGYKTQFLPVIEIKPLSDTRLLQKQIAELSLYDWAIFISRSAVHTSAALIFQQWPQLPSTLKVAAVGEGTAEALKEVHLPVTVYPPADWSSEGLLALPEFQRLSEKRLAIFCGQGGRELLAMTLQKRGAVVQRFVSYERVLPQLDLSPYWAWLRRDEVDAAVITSIEGLTNFKKLFVETEWLHLRKIPLVLISERIMIQAKAMGFEHCFLAKAANHEGISQALNRIRKEV